MQSRSCRLAQMLASLVFMFACITAAESAWEHPRLNHPEARNGFQEYKDYDEGNFLKVFVMSLDGGWFWIHGLSFKQALDRALTRCLKYAETSECQLFAVGNTIVWDMTRKEQERVIAEYKASKTPTTSIDTTAWLSRSAFEGFGVYQTFNDGTWFKVFVLAEDEGVWARRILAGYEDAFKAAMDGCERRASRRGLCRLFAVGDTIVWDMNDEERESVIEAYKSR